MWDVVAYSSPAQGTSYSNEVILIISGDSGAVRQAVISAREIGKTVLSTLGDTPKNDRPSYIWNSLRQIYEIEKI